MAEPTSPSHETSRITVPRDGEEARTFLQRRIAEFSRLMCLLSVGFFVVGNGIGLLHPSYSVSLVLAQPGNVWHLIAAAISGLVWFVARRTALSARALGLLDTGGTLATVAAYMMMGASARPLQDARFDLVLTLISMIFQMTRAVMVPSTARRTLLVGVGASLALLCAAYAIALRTHLATGGGVMMSVTYVGLWCATTVIPATLASRVIYGLRQQVREALQLGQYTLEEKIGEGGMGSVYRARHALLRRPTAIKLLAPERAGSHQLQRFEREVQLTSQLTHPNTVAIYDYGRTADGVFYYAMEFLDGIDLQQLVELDGPQEPSRVVHLLAQVCGALGEAHRVGLVHRDIKPANVIVCERGGAPDVAKVVDFGLVKELGAAQSPALTGVQGIVGTPLFMAPEAIQTPDSVDARSDLYACGALAYFLLTGTPVFEGSSLVEICSHHLMTPPERPAQRLGKPLPATLEAIVLRCLEKDPARRPANALALRDELLGCGVPAWTEAQARAAQQQLLRSRSGVRRQPKAEPRSPSMLTVDLRVRA